MNDWAELDRALGAMASSGNAEVREDGQWLAELTGLRCELRAEGKSPLVHLWSDERNLTRRILRVREQSQDRIVLEVQRFGRAKPGRLEFLRTDSPRPASRVTREQFRARFERFLAERFPDAAIDSLSAAPDLEHSFSGLYVRGRMREGAYLWAFLAVSPRESAATIDGILAFAILWLDWVREHSHHHGVEGMRLFVPAGTSRSLFGQSGQSLSGQSLCTRSLCARALALSTAARTEVYEFDDSDGRVEKMDASEVGNLESRLTTRREVESALSAAYESAARIPALAPILGEVAGRMRAHVLPGAKEVAFSFHGLEFACWSCEGVRFGLGDRLRPLTGTTAPALEQLVRQLVLHRSPLASDPKHSLYRAAPERWLETLVLEEPDRLDAQLDPSHLYSQVPALSAGDRGVIDLLGVTRRGRLVVIELKASEDIQLPIQALDYWLRVRRHQISGDFHRYGYFAGLEFDPKPPLVWLVAPGLHFHPATATLVRYFSPEIQVTRIGLNENWRRGLKVIFRQ
jgi:hypothetical protein